MKVALFQTAIIWENPQQNAVNLEQKINSLTDKVDLIILPEMFNSGFSMNPQQIAETMEGQTVSWMKSMATQKNTAITGSLAIFENGNYYNRMIFVYPNAQIKYYDKRHLFSLAHEDMYYKKGNPKVIIDFLGYKICMQICYDLRFPVFSRNIEGYDLLMYVANWPKTRINAWDVLLKARAVENLCYVIGVNRVGVDSNKLEYTGHSQVVDFEGNYVLEPQLNEGIFIVNLDKEKMDVYRKKFPFLNDKDNFVFL